MHQYLFFSFFYFYFLKILLFSKTLNTVKELSFPNIQEIIHFQLIGHQVWCGSFNGTIYVLDDEKHTVLKEIPSAHTKKINSFVDAGSFVWSGSGDGILCVWSKTDFQVKSHAFFIFPNFNFFLLQIVE